MFGPLANGIAMVVDIILNMMQLLIVASIIISWVGADPNNQIVTAIRTMTEPMFRPIRKLTKSFPGPIDWAPMILMLIIVFLQVGVVPYIRLAGTAAG
jgi:YggT family protein